jgi:hypothetical protein
MKAPSLAIVFGGKPPKRNGKPLMPDEETGEDTNGDEEEKDENEGLPELLSDFESAPDVDTRAAALAEFVREVMRNE